MTVHATLKPVASYQSDYETIVGILNDYFDGLFEGDVEKLRRIFHDDALNRTGFTGGSKS